MELSACCGAPLIVEYHSDSSHYSDDTYDLKVPVWICSMCGKVVERNLYNRLSPEKPEGP